MRRITTILGLCLCIGGVAFAEKGQAGSVQEAVLPNTSTQTGSEVISHLRQEYSKGTYNSFLDEYDAEVLSLKENGRLQEFSEMRQIPLASQQMKNLTDRYEKILKGLSFERNEQLKELTSAEAPEEISYKRLQSVLTEFSPEEEEAINYLSNLRFMDINLAANEDEKTLVEIDLMSEYKLIHLDSTRHFEEVSDFQEKQIVLEMDKIRRMQEASKSFSDSKIQKRIEIVARVHDALQAKNWDSRNLALTVKKPSTELERKIDSILTAYKAKQEDLYQKEFLAKLDLTNS